MHNTCPGAEEDIKWRFPVFTYKGGMFIHMAAFKNHCAFGFWKKALLKDDDRIFREGDNSAGSIGALTSVKDLPKDAILKKYIKAAMKINEDDISVPKPKPVAADKAELKTPEYFTKELKKHKAAEKVFNDFSYSNKKEYITWFEEAKTEPTRQNRIAQAIEWIKEGKGRNWKYSK